MMAVIFKSWIKRNDLKSNPDHIFLFGDNEQRRGYGGQAKECRGEPNALGITTKVSPSKYDDAYWSDDDFMRLKLIIDADFAAAFEAAHNGKTIIIPTAGLGTGLSELPTRAPKTYEYITNLVKELAGIKGPNDGSEK